ncbi:MAG: recombinase family protein [Abitibacteriaceae bacterium]|nr:recombinase family protein [Abditibacteriaceae bacterium]
MQSIQDQVRELRRLAQRRGLRIVEEYREERSAKAPGNRPLFEEMVMRLEAGEADSILCWNTNRLFRNPVDYGTISWMLQLGQIQSILTPDKEYRPGDNVVLLSVESAVANQFILDLRKGVLRGLKSKREKGWYPHCAPIGYRNDKYRDKGDRTISRDPELFPLIRQAWEHMLTGSYTVSQLRRILNEEWGVRTPLRKNGSGGTPVSKACLYKLFGNVFYAGYFRHQGVLYKGAHEPMVTLEEFDRVQKLIGRNNPIKPKKREFSYTGLIRCASCGGWVTAETKTKNSGKVYTYYHCNGSIQGCRKLSIREDDLEQRLDALFSELTILPRFYEWGLEELKKSQESEVSKQQAVQSQQRKALQETQRQLEVLLDMRMRELISDKEYLEKKNQLCLTQAQLEQSQPDCDEDGRQATGIIENALHFMCNVRGWFQNGDIKVKRTLARAVASNYLLRDGELALEADSLLLSLHKDYPRLEREFHSIELSENGSDNLQKDALASICLRWCSSVDSDTAEHTLELAKAVLKS